MEKETETMNAGQRTFLLALALFILALGSRAPHASAQHPVDSLKGLEAVYTYVEKLPQEIEKEGLTRAQLLKDVQRKLKRAGLKILTTHQLETEKGQSYLHIIAAVTKVAFGIKGIPDAYAYSVQVLLRQNVYLQRNVDVMIRGATTWQPPGYFWGVVSNPKEIRTMVRGQVDAFIKAWEAANR
jgi:hypothetical protein